VVSSKAHAVIIINDRPGITGARWSLQGAEAVLKLRSLKSSGDFEDYKYSIVRFLLVLLMGVFVTPVFFLQLFLKQILDSSLIQTYRSLTRKQFTNEKCPGLQLIV